MPSEPGPASADLRRLHPSSLIFSIGSAARRLLLPGFLLLFAASRGSSNLELWAMIFFGPALAGAVIRYLTYRYRLGDEELVIREGVVTRNERHIPYNRIQNIDLVQNPLHRLLQVAEVRLETAGGEKPEAVIRVLALADVEQMRAHVFAERAVAVTGTEPSPLDGSPAALAPTAAPVRQVYRMSAREVALFGIISNQGMVVVAALFGLLWQLDVMDRWANSLSKETLEGLPEFQPLLHPWAAALLGLAGLILFIVLLRVFSVAWAFLKFHGFTLTRQGEDLRAEYGLLTRLSKTVPRQRIQVVSARQGLLHRWFKRVAVQVETAGAAGGADGAPAKRTWLAPLIRRRELGRLFAEALPGLELDDVQWEPLAPRAFRRLLRRGLILTLIPVAGALVAFGWAGLLLATILFPGAWLNARLYVRHTGYALTSDTVLFRSGWWVRRISAARFSRIQALALSETPFDRRNDMATLWLDTAGAGPAGSRIAVAFLELSTAQRLHERLSLEAGRSVFRW